jgi:tetratricopeptide (TPR) repeat protein
MIAARQIESARQPLEKLVELETATGDQGGPLEMLARVYAEIDDRDAERDIHQRIVEQSSDALPSLRRLIEMAGDEEDWESVVIFADKIRSINPLLLEGHEALADAAEHLDRPAEVVAPLRAMLALEPIDPAEVDFRIARALADQGQRDRAKHHVLRALEQAPRYRNALRLLLDLSEPPAAEEADAETVGEQEAGEQAPAPAQVTPDSVSSEQEALP